MTDGPALNILLIDDDDVAAEAVQRGLLKQGMDCSVLLVGDGGTALQILRSGHECQLAKPYVVLLDLHTRGMSGFEFLHKLRADSKLHDIVVFVLTASSSESDRARAFRENVAGYIVKSAIGPRFQGLARVLGQYCRTARLS